MMLFAILPAEGLVSLTYPVYEKLNPPSDFCLNLGLLPLHKLMLHWLNGSHNLHLILLIYICLPQKGAPISCPSLTL